MVSVLSALLSSQLVCLIQHIREQISVSRLGCVGVGSAAGSDLNVAVSVGEQL